jgi:hypothetical protein
MATAYLERMLTPEEWRARGIVNVTAGHLAVSPCVRSRANGRVFAWHPHFAARPEAFYNCDENGNPDPRTWQGRGPIGLAAAAPPGPKPVLEPVASVPYANDVLGGVEAAARPAPPMPGAASPGPEPEPDIDPALLPPALG